MTTHFLKYILNNSVLLHRSGNLNLWDMIIYGGNWKLEFMWTMYISLQQLQENSWTENANISEQELCCVEKYFKKLLWERLMICPFTTKKKPDAQKKAPTSRTLFANHNEWTLSLITVQQDIMHIIKMLWSNSCPLKIQEWIHTQQEISHLIKQIMVFIYSHLSGSNTTCYLRLQSVWLRNILPTPSGQKRANLNGRLHIVGVKIGKNCYPLHFVHSRFYLWSPSLSQIGQTLSPNYTLKTGPVHPSKI